MTNHKDFAFPILVKHLQKIYESGDVNFMFWENKSGPVGSESNPEIGVQQCHRCRRYNICICPAPMTGLQITLQIVPGTSTDYTVAIINFEAITLTSEPV